MIIFTGDTLELIKIYEKSKPVGQDECPIGRLILGEDDPNPSDCDSFSQWAIDMERLFSDAEVSDSEFEQIGETIYEFETRVRQELINGFCYNPNN